MDVFTGGLVPALVILISNSFGGRHGSRRYERITTLFYWTFIIAFILYFFSIFFSLFFRYFWVQYCGELLLSLAVFSLFSAISRDYEKRLQPKINSWFKKNKQG